jgi:signal transduction histidine kinase
VRDGTPEDTSSRGNGDEGSSLPGGSSATSPTTRRLLDAADGPMALLDLDGRFLHVNDATVRCLGLDHAELRGSTLADLTDDPEAAAALIELWAGSTGRRPGALELAIGPQATTRFRCDGARLDADTLVVRFRDGDAPDQLARLNREVEAATLRELQVRLRATLGELEDANRQLSSRNSELERYASAVAHDLRTPVYIVRGYAELLAAGEVGEVDDEARRALGEVLRGVDRMSAVIDGLLTVARLQVTTPGEPADSGDALRVVLQERQDDIVRAKARVEVGPMEPAWAEPVHLVQVLSNLVGNSLKFRSAERDPTVWVSSRRLPSATEFVVEDDGLGVPPADRERIFDLFDRGGAPPDRPGTGIGLATCRKIVESYGGHIRCEASDHGGARFVFTIADPSAPAG